MNITDFINILILGVLCFIALKIHLIAYSVDKIAGVSHYQQQVAFHPSIKAEQVKNAESAVKRPITTSGLVDMSELPDELAIQALEKWGTE